MRTQTNYPEMNNNLDIKPEDIHTIQAEYRSIINKYKVKTKEPIEVKRGITADGVVGPIGANGVPNKHAGWNVYYMTPKAFDIFRVKNTVLLNILLD